MLGNGPEEKHLRQLSKDLGLESVVRFVGWRDDAVDWIAAADVVVQPSLCESFCQVLVEALAFRKPVIMTPVGAAPEIIGNNERGRLVPPRDSKAIAMALSELMQQPELGVKLGALGRSYIEENLTPGQTARQYEELYETVNREAAAAGRSHP
jgi:glycosyltransferase involved in cell wall biosynthesis